MGLVHNKQFHIGADYFSGSPSLEEKASLKAMFFEKNLLKQKTEGTINVLVGGSQ